jgi:NitT/TauT family transport system permease protein/taurine transport system permease protein
MTVLRSDVRGGPTLVEPAVPDAQKPQRPGHAEAPGGRTGAARRDRAARRSVIRSVIMTTVSLLAGLAVWHLVSTYLINPHLIPPPLAVAKTAGLMVRTGEIFRHAAASLGRILVGFLLGSGIAIVLGVLMGRIRLVNELSDPIIEVLRYLSPTAMIPIAVIWFGIGETSKYFLIFWGTFFFVLINTIAGVVRTPVARQRAARCLGANELQIFLLVVIPSALPYIVTGMRVAMAASFMSIIPAEMLAADSGLGYLLQQSSLLIQTDRIFVALAMISGLGFLTDRLFRLVVERTLRRFMAVGLSA